MGLLTSSRSKPLWRAQVLVSTTPFMPVPMLRIQTVTALTISLLFHTSGPFTHQPCCLPPTLMKRTHHLGGLLLTRKHLDAVAVAEPPLHPLLLKLLVIMRPAVPTSSSIRKLSSKPRNQPIQIISLDAVQLIKDLNVDFARLFSPLFEVHNILSSSTGKNMEMVQVLPPATFIFRILKATWKRTLPQFRDTALQTSYRNFSNTRRMNNVSLMRKECHSLWQHSGSNWSKSLCQTTSYVTSWPCFHSDFIS
jgi:hypothetical protein